MYQSRRPATTDPRWHCGKSLSSERPRRNLLPVPPPPYSSDGRSATSAVKGRRFKLRYYRNLLLPPARPSGSNADALPRVTPITLSPGPAEPANQPGLDWIAADPEHDRDGRGRRLRCDPRRLAPAATIAAICCLTCFARF